MKSEPSSITFEAIASDPEVRTLIAAADRKLAALGFNEHGFRHAHHVSACASGILKELAFDSHQQELAKIAGLLHDIGNSESRRNHATTSATLAHDVLSRMGMAPNDIATIVGAIGSHGGDDSGQGVATDPVSAALILADKSDVHRSRVRTSQTQCHDLHDRVGFSVLSSITSVSSETRKITMELVQNVGVASSREFRELFQRQLMMCRQAAEILCCTFDVVITEVATD